MRYADAIDECSDELTSGRHVPHYGVYPPDQVIKLCTQMRYVQLLGDMRNADGKRLKTPKALRALAGRMGKRDYSRNAAV